jgi:type I restriction enzyme M protein
VDEGALSLRPQAQPALHPKKNPLRRHQLDELVELYNPENRHDRTPNYSEESPDWRWRRYAYEEIMRREGANLVLS